MIENIDFQAWRKPTRSNGSGNCVEVALGPVVGVRDTKNRQAGHLVLGSGAWSAFLTRVAAE